MQLKIWPPAVRAVRNLIDEKRIKAVGWSHAYCTNNFQAQMICKTGPVVTMELPTGKDLDQHAGRRLIAGWSSRDSIDGQIFN